MQCLDETLRVVFSGEDLLCLIYENCMYKYLVSKVDMSENVYRKSILCFKLSHLAAHCNQAKRLSDSFAVSCDFVTKI